MKKWIYLITLSVALAACHEGGKTTEAGYAGQQHDCVEALTKVIVHDILPPPVANRMYAYCNIAYYEALRGKYRNTPSLFDSLHGFMPVTLPDSNSTCDYGLSALTAFMQVARALVFSKDSMRAAHAKLLQRYKVLDGKTNDNAVKWGERVAEAVLERARSDYYRETRGMPRYSVFAEPGKWQQTPPEYADALEPYWNLIKPLKMETADACRPEPPVPFSTEKGSPYFNEVWEVYRISKNRTGLQDTIAHFWDDNPFVVKHTGHLTFAHKKITPGGHWMGIVRILCEKYGGNEWLTAKAYALTSSAIFDGFISCWEEKFNSRMVRPITVIREFIEPEWVSMLQTPPFPEYTSGHSVISSAAAEVLTGLFGDVPFHDNSELPYLGMERSFSSPRQAAEEASISRLYGGIHYRSALEAGLRQGTRVGQLFRGLF